MRKIMNIILLFLVIFLMGCNKEEKQYEIKLEGNTEEEYIWSYDIDNLLVAGINSQKYIGSESNEKKELGGEYIYYVNGKSKGVVNIKFQYKHAWNNDIKYDYSVKLKIDKDLKISKISESGSYLALQYIIENKDKIKIDISNYDIYFEENLQKINDIKCYIGIFTNKLSKDDKIEFAVSKDIKKIYIKENNKYKKIK